MSNLGPVLIIGAGIAGLMAASRLRAAGRAAIVIDEGGRTGGRMATRDFAGGRFDSGAQFFTAREPEFQSYVRGWLTAGAAVPWTNGFAGPDGVPRDDGHPRYRGTTGMTAVPEHLGANLDVRLGQRVTAVWPADGGWQIQIVGGARFSGSALLLTPPVPQSLALLEAGSVALPSAARRRLESILYAPCLALLARLAGPSAVPGSGGLQIGGNPVFWIGDNQKKGISTVPAVTIHGGPEFSRGHWDADEAVIVDALQSAAGPWLGSAVLDWDVQRWRYSLPLTPLHERCLPVQNTLPPLLFAGDAFGGPRVEGAALSGLAAAQALLRALPQT